jgi:lipopolysaccharide export system protein LptA
MQSSKRMILALLFGMMSPLAALALSSDKQQPIRIEADSVVIDDTTGTAVYRGNVHYTQGSTHLDAEEVTVYSADRQKVDKVVSDGKPATFRQRPDKQKEDLRGQATHIEYYAADDRVVLDGDAHLWQGKNEFAGSRIEYDTAKETVKAIKSATDEGRVHVIIQPSQAPETPAASTPSP